MSFFEIFRAKKTSSAAIAKERLQIIVAHGGRRPSSPDFLPRLQQDILAEVRKYIPISEDQIHLSIDRKDDCEVLELNVSIPDASGGQTGKQRF